MFEIKAKDKMVERALLIGAYIGADKKADAQSLLAELEELVDTLGKFPLSVEVVEYGHATTMRKIADVAAALGYPAIPITQRSKDGAVFKTDGGNLIYDAACGAIREPAALAAALKSLTGVVEHGLFLDLAELALIGTDQGVMTLEP